MLHHQWSTEVGKLRVAPAMAPSREPRMDCLAAWQPHAILETEKTAHCRKSSRGSATLTSYRARFLPVD